MADFTRGPWSAFRYKGVDKWRIGCPDNQLLMATSTHKNNEANAHLISAAPCLFNALKNIMNGIETGMIAIDSPADETLANALRQAKAALSKASPTHSLKEG